MSARELADAWRELDTLQREDAVETWNVGIRAGGRSTTEIVQEVYFAGLREGRRTCRVALFSSLVALACVAVDLALRHFSV